MEDWAANRRTNTALEIRVRHTWQFRQVSLRFSLSDKTLLAPRLWLQVCEIGLTNEVQPAMELQPPSDALEPESQGFLIRSMPIATTQPTVRRFPEYLCYVSTQYRRYYIDLRQSFGDYQKKFSAKTRATITRKVRRYAEYCGRNDCWKVYKAPDEIHEFFKFARIVSAKTYQEKLLNAGLPESEEFLRTIESLAKDGRVRGYLLFDGEQPVAYLYCPIHDGTLQYQYLGYDPAYAKWSVGTVLQWYALESIFAEGNCGIFDFTEGQSEQKRLFSTHNVQCMNVFFLRRTLRNTLLVLAHVSVSAFSRWSGETIDRFGLRNKIRKLIRFGR
jgi:CelD/BcsL family acetyltransferase involved in cellulose biosynthesis